MVYSVRNEIETWRFRGNTLFCFPLSDQICICFSSLRLLLCFSLRESTHVPCCLYRSAAPGDDFVALVRTCEEERPSTCVTLCRSSSFQDVERKQSQEARTPHFLHYMNANNLLLMRMPSKLHFPSRTKHENFPQSVCQSGRSRKIQSAGLPVSLRRTLL